MSTNGDIDMKKGNAEISFDGATYDEAAAGGSFQRPGVLGAGRAEAEKKLLRKIDRRMSILVLIYVMNYLDRNQISAARLKGLQEDLKISDTQYQTLLSILYVGYILMQVPSNIFLNRIGRPSIHIGVAMAIWGMLSAVMGTTHNFVGALFCRFFLGFVEAAFLPGALFLLSKWYTKKELALRYTILYVGNLSSNALNGLIASAILSNMEGVLGHRAWRWLFYIEGSITVAIAFLAYLILPDFPTTTKWLTEDEKILAQARLSEDGGESDEIVAEESEWQSMWSVVTDYKVWMLTLIMTSQVLGLSFNAFFPTLTQELGYSSTISLLLTAPPWAFACLVAFANSWHADRTGDKCFHIVPSILVGIIGCILGIATKSVAARYVGLFLMAQSYAGFIVVYSWIPTTIARPTGKRAIALAFINAFSQLGNIAGSYVWPARFAPYHNSFGICIACFGLSILVCFFLRWDLQRLNKKMDEGMGAEVHSAAVAESARLEGVDIATAAAARKGGDTHINLMGIKGSGIFGPTALHVDIS